jgi:hypothetical protein
MNRRAGWTTAEEFESFLPDSVNILAWSEAVVAHKQNAYQSLAAMT